MSPRSLSEIAARHVPYFLMCPFEHFPISNVLCPMPQQASVSRRWHYRILFECLRLLQQEAWGALVEHFPMSTVLCPMPYAPASLREQTLALPISVRVPRLLQQEAWGMGIPATPPRTDVGLPIPFKIQNSKFKMQHASVRSWRELPESSVWVRVVRCACGICDLGVGMWNRKKKTKRTNKHQSSIIITVVNGETL